MKKISLIIILIMAIFQMIVLATAIDIGNVAINRDGYTPYTSTLVDIINPANASGKITSIEIWAYESMSAIEIATFYVVSGNNLSTRDSVTLGAVTAGSKQTFTTDSGGNPISLNVQTGDYLGTKFTDGQIERTNGSGGYLYKSGDQIPCTNETFAASGSGSELSLYGIGVTPNAIMFGMNF